MKIHQLSLIALLACSAFLTGCVSPMSPEKIQAEVARAGYGSPPSTAWQDAVKEFMTLRLKDGVSAIYKFEEPKQAYLTHGAFQGGGFKAAGYMVDVQINAKNSYGAYIGFERYRFLIRDDKVLHYATLHGTFWSWD